jgi:hypothetical protein
MSSSSQLPGSGGQRGPGPARTLHRCWITRHATCGSHATCGTSGTRRGSVGCGRGILAAWRTGQSSRTAQSRLTWHVHWHGLPLRKSRGTSAGLATTAALTAAALATTRWEGRLRHRTKRTRSRARVRELASRDAHGPPKARRGGRPSKTFSPLTSSHREITRSCSLLSLSPSRFRSQPPSLSA